MYQNITQFYCFFLLCNAVKIQQIIKIRRKNKTLKHKAFIAFVNCILINAYVS